MEHVIHVDRLKAKNLQRRRFVCNLPTELVLTQRNVIPELNRVYCHNLPSEFWAECKIGGAQIRGRGERRYLVSDERPYLLELHFDWGDDGHTSYELEDYYLVIKEEEIPWNNTSKYLEIIDKSYDLVRGDNDLQKQFCFNRNSWW